MRNGHHLWSLLAFAGVFILSACAGGANAVVPAATAVQGSVATNTASVEAARDMLQQRGLDLSQHASQPVTDPLVRCADHILTMTESHRQIILSVWPEAAGKTQLLRRDGGDVADPIGGPVDEYVQCADQIEQHLRIWQSQLDTNTITRFVVAQDRSTNEKS